ncbi:hypothetical protein [Haloarcula montana]|uniref:hypothetical protein n=1 Tax=Haloarcula montana TaxID=3111776 RepID=UPI002D791024|nr:hypothetical protein [Haloarcula sp. GH36]
MTRDIKKDLVAFLREHFDDSVVPVTFDAGDPTQPATDGDVRFADYDGANDYPQVAIASEDPTVAGGGETGYSGMDPGGNGGIQDTITSVQIDCWGGPDDADIYQSDGSHPDVVANALGREVHDILFEADESDDGPPTPDGYDWVNAQPPTESNDTERSPTHYRRFVVARLKHTE